MNTHEYPFLLLFFHWGIFDIHWFQVCNIIFVVCIHYKKITTSVVNVHHHTVTDDYFQWWEETHFCYCYFFFFFCPHHVPFRISVPWPGIELWSWQWKLRIPTTRPPGNSQEETLHMFFPFSFANITDLLSVTTIGNRDLMLAHILHCGLWLFREVHFGWYHWSIWILPKWALLHFLIGSDDKEPACTAGVLGSIPGLGRSPRGGNGTPLQYSCLKNSMDRGPCLGYSPQHCKDLNMTEWLTLSLKNELYYTGLLYVLM